MRWDSLIFGALIFCMFAIIPIAIAFILVRMTLSEKPRLEASGKKDETEALTESKNDPRPYYHAEQTPVYVPNHIPSSVRNKNILLSLLLIVYGIFGLYIDDIYVPAKRGGLHFHGLSAEIVFLSMMVAVTNMMAVVIDHYDERNNERHYEAFAKYSQILGWLLFIFAGIVGLALHQMSGKH